MDKHLEKTIQKSINGDKKSLERLMEIKHKEILYYTISLAPSKNLDAQDIAQEAMVAIIKNISKLREPACFTSWMCRIVRNTMVDMMNKIKNEKSVALDSYEDDYIEEENKEFLPEEFIEDEEKNKILVDVIEGLPENYREALMLRYYMNLSYKEISEVMDANNDKVKNDIARGKRLMKKRLEEKTHYSFKDSIVPVGAIPVLSQVFEADATSKISGDFFIKTWMGAVDKLGGIPGDASVNLTSNTIGRLFVIGIASIVTATGVGVGIHKMNRVGGNEQIEAKSQIEISQESSLEASVTEKEIITLADMIGETNAQKLDGFDKGGTDKQAMELFINEIGAKISNKANAQDDSEYFLYILEKQNKRLWIAEKRGKNNKSQIIYNFGSIDEKVPKMPKIILSF